MNKSNKIIINMDQNFLMWWNELGGVKDDETMMVAAWWAYCEGKKVKTPTAEKDRHYICEIGRLFWGENKQCYAADAVFREVIRRMEVNAK